MMDRMDEDIQSLTKEIEKLTEAAVEREDIDRLTKDVDDLTQEIEKLTEAVEKAHEDRLGVGALLIVGFMGGIGASVAQQLVRLLDR
jgi:hypothetical protein